jgi:hypothetical protein
MRRTLKELTIVAKAMVVYAIALVQVKAGEQIRVYDSRGNSVGTIVPQSDGSTRYYNSRGNSMGTSTTTLWHDNVL